MLEFGKEIKLGGLSNYYWSVPDPFSEGFSLIDEGNSMSFRRTLIRPFWPEWQDHFCPNRIIFWQCGGAAAPQSPASYAYAFN